MEPTVFTRIIRGEIPSHKVYEDDNTLAFLNIHPSQPGHVLVVPKAQVPYLHQLEAEDYQNLMVSVQKVAKRLAEVFGEEYKICLKVMGFDVPHVHVHLLPCKTPADFAATENMDEPDHEAFAAMAAKLAF